MRVRPYSDDHTPVAYRPDVAYRRFGIVRIKRRAWPRGDGAARLRDAPAEWSRQAVSGMVARQRFLFVEARRPIRNFKSMLDDIREQRDRWQQQAERVAALAITDQRKEPRSGAASVMAAMAANPDGRPPLFMVCGPHVWGSSVGHVEGRQLGRVGPMNWRRFNHGVGPGDTSKSGVPALAIRLCGDSVKRADDSSIQRAGMHRGMNSQTRCACPSPKSSVVSAATQKYCPFLIDQFGT
jgi:hypothetical protein